MSLSIIIPCRNEESTINYTIKKIVKSLKKKIKQYEIILINDNSSDQTYKILSNIKKQYKNIKIANNGRIGLGGSIELGINLSKNKYIAIMMADLSDNPNDLIRYYKIISKKKLHAVFGSRFLKNSKIKYYPIRKLIFNRIFNIFVKILFLSRYNDFTNAFKIYEKKSLFDIKPLVSENFNIFLELPLKIITRNKKFEIIPISWINRKKGSSKFKINELSSKYIFTLIYCYAEKILLK